MTLTKGNNVVHAREMTAENIVSHIPIAVLCGIVGGVVDQSVDLTI